MNILITILCTSLLVTCGISTNEKTTQIHLNNNQDHNMIKKAYLAGGCFWGMEELFRSQPGVKNTEVGYMGGENKNPTYKNHPGHAEALEIEFDSTETSFLELLDFFFRIHNPTTVDRQGNDIGSSYRSAIFYQNEAEKLESQKMIQIVNDSKRWEDPVVTTLEPFDTFWPAEDNHQDYLQHYPNGYTCHFVRTQESFLKASSK